MDPLCPDMDQWFRSQGCTYCISFRPVFGTVDRQLLKVAKSKVIITENSWLRLGIKKTDAFLNWDSMRYVSMVSILPTVDGGQHTHKQIVVPAWKISSVLLWTGSAAKHISAT